MEYSPEFIIGSIGVLGSMLKVGENRSSAFSSSNAFPGTLRVPNGLGPFMFASDGRCLGGAREYGETASAAGSSIS